MSNRSRNLVQKALGSRRNSGIKSTPMTLINSRKIQRRKKVLGKKLFKENSINTDDTLSDINSSTESLFFRPLDSSPSPLSENLNLKKQDARSENAFNKLGQTSKDSTAPSTSNNSVKTPPITTSSSQQSLTSIQREERSANSVSNIPIQTSRQSSPPTDGVNTPSQRSTASSAGLTNEPVLKGSTSGPVLNGPTSGPVLNGPTSGPVLNGPTNGPVLNGPTNGSVLNDQTNGSVLNDQTKKSNLNDQTNGSSPNSSRKEIPADPDPTSYLDVSWLRKVLVKSLDGRTLLQFYNRTTHLPESKRKVLTKCIIDYELESDISKLISPFRLQCLAHVIPKVFPTEQAETYFIPYSKNECGTLRARGMLYERYMNKRRSLKYDNLIIGRQKFADKDTESDDSYDIDPELENDRRWLENNTAPWDRVIEVNDKTYELRIHMYKKNQTTICDYFSQYAPYTEREGYVLIDRDFERKFPENANGLFNNWPDIEPKILSLALQKSDTDKIGETLISLGIDLTLHDQRNKHINSVRLVAALLPPVTVKKRWRLSKAECTNAFVLKAENAEEAQLKYEARVRKLASYGLEVPILIFITDPFLIEIRLKDLKWKFLSFLKGFDVYFKLFKILEEPYPVDCSGPFEFFDEFIYGTNNQLNLKYPYLRRFYADICHAE